MKKTFVILLLAAGCTSLSGAEKLVNDASFTLPDAWNYQKIMGKDYWPMMGFYPHVKDPDGLNAKNAKRASTFARQWLELDFPMKKEVREKYKKLGITFQEQNLPAFTKGISWRAYSGVGISAKVNPEKKNTYGVFLKKEEEFDLAKKRNIPFVITSEILARGSIGRLLHVTGEDYCSTAQQKADFEKWYKEHPNFKGFYILSEWDNNTYILENFYKRAWWNAAVKAKRVKAEEKEKYWKKFKEKWPDAKNRKEWIQKRLRPYYQRGVDASFGRKELVIPLSGSVNINHLAAYWGSKLICVETSRHNTRWQGQMMFTRGAARQFGIPWGWYVAGFMRGYTTKGKLTVDSSPSNPPGGISLSAIRRGYFMTFLGGANIMESEIALWTSWTRQLKKNEPFALTGAGKAYVGLYDFIRKHPDRGVPYTPIALLVNYDRGSNRQGGRAFWKFPYTHADSMLDAFFNCILDRGYNDGTTGKRGIEYVMGHNPYGDIFDAVTPDFEDQSTFKKVLPSYKVAILLGEYEKNPALAEILIRYVKNGGTLLMNVKHLPTDLPDAFKGFALKGETVISDNFKVEKAILKNGRILEKDKNGHPVLIVSDYGKGKVLTSLQHYMTNYTSGQIKGKLPLIDKVLRQFSSETLPVKVEGDIQFGINKNKVGWRIYLINNKGVRKFTDAPQIVDLKQTKNVKISFPRIKVKKVTEILENTPVEMKNGSLTVKVPPGEIRILEIITGNEPVKK